MLGKVGGSRKRERSTQSRKPQPSVCKAGARLFIRGCFWRPSIQRITMAMIIRTSPRTAQAIPARPALMGTSARSLRLLWVHPNLEKELSKRHHLFAGPFLSEWPWTGPSALWTAGGAAWECSQPQATPGAMHHLFVAVVGLLLCSPFDHSP